MNSGSKRHYSILAGPKSGSMEYQVQPEDGNRNDQLILYDKDEFESSKTQESVAETDIKSSGSESGFMVPNAESSKPNTSINQHRQARNTDKQLHLDSLAEGVRRLHQVIQDKPPASFFPITPNSTDESKSNNADKSNTNKEG